MTQIIALNRGAFDPGKTHIIKELMEDVKACNQALDESTGALSHLRMVPLEQEGKTCFAFPPSNHWSVVHYGRGSPL